MSEKTTMVDANLKEQRQMLVSEYQSSGRPIRAKDVYLGYDKDDSIILRAMERWGQEVERRTIERCAKGVERLRSQRVCAEVGPKAPDPLESEWYEALTDAVFAILALQDAPSDDTPPARKAELWSDGNG